MSATLTINTRVVNHDGAAGLLVGRIDRNFVEVNYDEPQRRFNHAGAPYLTGCECIHVELLRPENALF